MQLFLRHMVGTGCPWSAGILITLLALAAMIGGGRAGCDTLHIRV